MNGAEKYRPYYTYKDYLEWEGRWELIDGLPYAMSPSPNVRHQMIVSQLHYIFTAAIKNVKCRQCKVLDYTDWKIAEDTVLQPDVLIVCRLISHKNYLDFPPDLVIEILSPSTALKDRREKFEIYQTQGVKYYLIVDPVFNKVEIFLNNNSIYEAASVNPQSFNFLLGECGIDVDFTELFEE
jgi:Uma2 family endonuclease